ncbi:hypothetical protein [Thiothrix eikelboomii]|uniref:hypothetical protein n=1 Tax=Thiothrix eikelboomii TaxID=92487 RepID=UPI003BAEA8E3
MSAHPYTYTDQDGYLVAVPCLDWLEDGVYWADSEDDEIGEYLPCSRYCIGEADGDSQSIWLNDDLVEVQA